MPLAYRLVASAVGCGVDAGFLDFLGGLPASASVYALTLTRELSPRVVGPLVPASMILCVAILLAPLHPLAAALRVADALRALVALGAVGATLAAARGRPVKVE